VTSVHRTAWPAAEAGLADESADRSGAMLVGVASAVRRYKSEAGLGLATVLERLELATGDAQTAALLREAQADLMSVTRALKVDVGADLSPDARVLSSSGEVRVGLG